MKTRNLFFAGLVGLGMMTGCSSESDPINENGNGSQGEKAYTQLTFTIANSNAPSATRATDPTEGATTENEMKVISIMLVIATNDANDPKVIASYNLPADKFIPTGTGSEKTYTTKDPIETVTGDVKVYAFVNSNINFVAGESVNRILTVANTTTSTDNIYGSIKSSTGINPFFMANTEDVTTNLQGIDDDNFDEGEANKINKVSVTVERIVSKVTFSATTGIADNTFIIKNASGTEIAKAKVEGANIINLNMKSNLLKKDMYYYNVTNPAYSNLFYVSDPNTTVMDCSTEEGTTAANAYIAANFCQTTTTTFKPIGTAAASGSTGRDQDAFYCLENTMYTPEAQQNGQTTGAIFKVTYTVTTNGFSAIGGGEGTLLATNFNAFKTKYTDVITENFWGQASGSKDFYTYNDLIFGNQKAAVLYKLLSEATTTLDETALAALKSTYDTESVATTMPNKISKYAEGICYYTAWIRHNVDSNAGFMEKGKYGMVRNHWYDINVNSISGLGTVEPTIPGKPDEPDDKVKSKLEVAVKIIPWRYIQQGVDL